MHEELELKLAVAPGMLKRLRGDPLIRSLACRRASTKRLHTTYFDTPAHDLRRRGMALRIRQVGKRRIQTLKVPANGDTGLQHYREYEADVATEAPDVSRIDDASLRRLFETEDVTGRLEPVFSTVFSRSTVPLKLEDSEVELALDSGEIAAGGHSLPICEAELELVSGSSRRIYELALALALNKRIAFRLETRTKAARGYQLSAGLHAGPRKATALELYPEMTVGEVFAAAARSCLQQIRENEAAVLLGDDAPRDPEAVHQLRVGVRRLRVLVTVFKEALTNEAQSFLRDELSWLQGALGPAREWDVFVLETLSPLRRRLEGDSDLATLAEAAEARREFANQAARAALLEPRYTEFLLRFELWLGNGSWALRGGGRGPKRRIGRFAAEALDKRSRKLHKLTRKWKTLPEAELHEVRILAKKLRYTMEFFQSLYPGKSLRSQIKAVGRIQDTLGSLNDAVVDSALLAALEDAASPRAAALVKGWQAACIERDLAHFRDDLKAYESCQASWA